MNVPESRSLVQYHKGKQCECVLSGAAKKTRGEQTDPLVKRLLFIPGLGSDVSSEKPIVHKQMQAVSKDKPKSPTPPPAVEEARPMSPSRDQEGEPMVEAEPLTITSKLPYRCVADIDGECISITGPDGDRVYAARTGPPKASCNATTVHNKGTLFYSYANKIVVGL